MIGWFGALQDAILHHAGEWWTYAVTATLCLVDGFFPPVPSESLVIGMASLSSTHGGPVLLWVLWPLACVGAWAGDNVAYWIGRLVPVHRLFRGERGRDRLARARQLLSDHGPEVLISGRFIPVYRVAINMVAGTMRYPYRRFALIDVASTLLWAVFSVGVGLAAGSAFHRRPLLGIVIGVILGIVLGKIIERIAAWQRSRRHKQPNSVRRHTKLGS